MSTFSGAIVEEDDFTTVEQSSSEKPLVKLVPSATTSLGDNSETPVSFGSTEIDTDSFWSAGSPTRITPTVEGYYRLSGVVMFASRTDYVIIGGAFAKNGSVQIPRVRIAPGTAGGARTVSLSTILTANGSTDYFELMAVQDNSAGATSTTSASGSFSSSFECEFLRPL